MAYNASLYNPYGSNQFQPTTYGSNQFQPTTISYAQQYQPTFQPQQPINGLTFIDIENLDSYKMPPGSVSHPLFVDAEHFVIKTFDSNGGSSVEAYKATKIPLSSLLDSGNDNVTRADLDAFKAEIMEAINGKHSISNVPAETATSSQQPA